MGSTLVFVCAEVKVEGLRAEGWVVGCHHYRSKVEGLRVEGWDEGCHHSQSWCRFEVEGKVEGKAWAEGYHHSWSAALPLVTPPVYTWNRVTMS